MHTSQRLLALLLLAACTVPPSAEDRPKDDSADPDSADPDTDDTDDTGIPDTDTGVPDTDTDTGAPDTDTVSPITCTTTLPSLGDTAGGGGRVVLTLTSTVDVTGATLGGVPLSAFAIDDDTHVSGVPGAHPGGVVEVAISTTGGDIACEGAFEYWTPAQITHLDVYLDADKGVTDAGAVSAWIDQGPNAREFTQAASANQPVRTPNVFGTMPSLRFVPNQFLKLPTPVDLSAAGTSVFAVAKWTATTAVTPPPGNAGNVPLTIVGDGTNGYGSFGAKGGEIESNHYVGGAALVNGGAALNDGVARLIGATYDTTTVTKIYVGNTQQGVDETSAALIGRNTYDTIGAGYPGADGWDGDLGAVIVVSGVISVEDRTKLDMWSQQRWGTPVSAPLDTWSRHTIGSMPLSPDEWYPRDGAQMVQLASGRVLMIGGWSPYDPWGAGDRITNEVWASDDAGVTWSLLLPHDPDPPESGPGARFPPAHTIGVTTYRGNAVVMGTDPNVLPYLGEVWHESDDGETWTRVTTDAPTAGRCLFMVGTLGDDLYVMGGQTNEYIESTALADVWRSTDGGLTWTELATPPWSGRGMVYRPVEHDGQLVVVGGGRYDDTDPVAFNGVFAFDGATWTTVLPDGHTQWEATYYNALATLDGRLWLFNGFTGTEELVRALYSDDGGLTWSESPGGSGGVASHADAVVALEDRVLRVSGSLSERNVYAFVPE